MISKEVIEKLKINLDFKSFNALEEYANEQISFLFKELKATKDTTRIFTLQGEIASLEKVANLKKVVEESLKG